MCSVFTFVQYITVWLSFQRTDFFHLLAWQMPLRHFRRFDLSRYAFNNNFQRRSKYCFFSDRTQSDNYWSVVLGFNATLTTKVISLRSVTHMCFLTPVLTQLFFQSHRQLFSHASAEVRGENTPERKVASTGDRTHNHKVICPTGSPLSHPGGAQTDNRVGERTEQDQSPYSPTIL